MLRCENGGAMTLKADHQTTANGKYGQMIDPSAVPYIRKVYVWGTPKGAYNPECLVPTAKHGGRFCDHLGSNIVVQYSVSPIITLHDRITARQ
jgi:hypothetical protein